MIPQKPGKHILRESSTQNQPNQVSSFRLKLSLPQHRKLDKTKHIAAFPKQYNCIGGTISNRHAQQTPTYYISSWLYDSRY